MVSDMNEATGYIGVKIEDGVQQGIRKMVNWKSPGIYQVQNFWIKRMTWMHSQLTKAMNNILNKTEVIPEWWTQGTTSPRVVIQSCLRIIDLLRVGRHVQNNYCSYCW